MRKNLLVSNHSIMRYGSRTGRQNNLVAGLVESIKNGKQISITEVLGSGFSLKKAYKNDTYYIWYDEQIHDDLVAIVTNAGIIKTVLRREMFTYINYNCKIRHEFNRQLIKQ